MKKKLSIQLIGFLSVVMLLGTLSCQKTFDIEPKSAIVSDQMYRNVYDADAAVFGIYGKFLNLLDRYVILNELRSDLADVTPNSDKYLIQLSTHSVTEDNPYADPRPYYEVILNCNDALKNFDIMRAERKMNEDQYKERYSDLGALRSWLYLQLGIQYGSIPYITEPFENINDLNDESKYPKISFDVLLDNLIQYMESLPSNMPYSVGSTLRTTVDTYNTEKIFINKNCLLGDLYLWKGDWTSAATAYRDVLRIGEVPQTVNEEQYYEVYKLSYRAEINGGNWINIFRNTFGERYSNYEIMWNIPYDKNFNPKNPFIDLFSIFGKYVMKPSDLAINNWNAQYRNDNGALPGTPGDRRGLNFSYRMYGTMAEINKYTYNYSPMLPFETTGKIILYRTANLFLRFSEAANHDGRDKLALAFVNNGVPNVWQGSNSDKTLLMQSINPFTGLLDTPPYDFDGRMGDIPRYRSRWYRNIGVRNRINDMNIVLDSAKYFNLTVTPRVLTNATLLKKDVEDYIIAESGLETAFEGNRWGDLLRIALRRQATEPNYLSNKIGAKFDASHSGDAAAVRARLSDKANWYLPFRWK